MHLLCYSIYQRKFRKQKDERYNRNKAKQIVATGRRELILIAQDTSKYGKDIYGEPKLAELLTELCKIKDLKWVRFLYTYPEDITDELIKL